MMSINCVTTFTSCSVHSGSTSKNKAYNLKVASSARRKCDRVPALKTLQLQGDFSGIFSVSIRNTQYQGTRKSRDITRCSTTGDDHGEDSKKGGGFLWGFLVGGAVFGSLAFLFAPQLSKRLRENDQIRLPRFLNEDDDDLETTRRTLNDKIAQLNQAIDEVSAQLEGSDDAIPKSTSG